MEMDYAALANCALGGYDDVTPEQTPNTGALHDDHPTPPLARPAASASVQRRRQLPRVQHAGGGPIGLRHLSELRLVTLWVKPSRLVWDSMGPSQSRGQLACRSSTSDCAARSSSRSSPGPSSIPRNKRGWTSGHSTRTWGASSVAATATRGSPTATWSSGRTTPDD